MSAAFLALGAANPGLVVGVGLAGGVDVLAAMGVKISPSDPPKPRSPYVGLPSHGRMPESRVTEAEKERAFLAALLRNTHS